MISQIKPRYTYPAIMVNKKSLFTYHVNKSPSDSSYVHNEHEDYNQYDYTVSFEKIRS